MSADERAEFLDLYQRTSAHLSQLRSTTPDVSLDARLTRIIADASNALYGQRGNDRRAFFRFFTETFPAAVWHLRRYVAVASLLFFAPAIIMGVWVGVSDDAQSTIPPALAETYVNDDFEAYYSSEAAAEFATTVFINNIWVSFLAFALGIVFCVGTAFVLVNNGIVVGQAGGLFAAAGQLDKFPCDRHRSGGIRRRASNPGWCPRRRRCAARSNIRWRARRAATAARRPSAATHAGRGPPPCAGQPPAMSLLTNALSIRCSHRGNRPACAGEVPRARRSATLREAGHGERRRLFTGIPARVHE